MSTIEELWPDPVCESFSEQVALFNRAVAGRVAGSSGLKGEWIAQERLFAELLTNERPKFVAGSSIIEALFNAASSFDLANTLEGCLGFSNEPGSTKTTFWWFIGGRGPYRRFPVRITRDFLMTDDGRRFSVSFEELRDHVQSRTLIPSALTKYMVLNVGWGLSLCGGHNQVQALATLQEKLRAAGYLDGRPADDRGSIFCPTRWFPITHEFVAPQSPLELLVTGDTTFAPRVLSHLGDLSVATLLELYAPAGIRAIKRMQ